MPELLFFDQVDDELIQKMWKLSSRYGCKLVLCRFADDKNKQFIKIKGTKKNLAKVNYCVKKSKTIKPQGVIIQDPKRKKLSKKKLNCLV